MNIDYYIKNFYQHEIDRGVSIYYAKMQKQCCQEFAAFMQDKGILNPTDIARADLKEYHEYLEQRPKKRGEGTLSTVMIRHNLNSVTYLFNYLEANEIIKENLTCFLELPETTSEKRIILDREEIKQLLASCLNLTEQTIIKLAYGAAMRRKEINRLNIDDIDFKGNMLHVKGKGNKKQEYKPRHIQLPESLTEDLKLYYLEERPKYVKTSKQDHENAFLLTTTGTRMSGTTIAKWFHVIVQRAGIEKNVSLHCLRHSIACELIDSGMKMELVQKYLGHSHLDTTLIYLQYTKKKVY